MSAYDDWLDRGLEICELNKRIAELEAERDELRETVRMCMAIANNVIYLDDNSDYRDGLRDIAHEAGMKNDDIGTAYIEAQGGRMMNATQRRCCEI